MGRRGQIPLVRQQFDPGTRAGGVYTKGDMRETKIRGFWQPMPTDLVQLLEEGDRLKSPKVLFTRTALLVTNQHDNQPPDHISPDAGVTFYEVISEYKGDNRPGFSTRVRHRKYALLRLQEADG